MGRPTEGWKLRWRNGRAYVRFVHDGRPYEIATGERDPRAAARKAASLYADTIAGRQRPRRRRRTAATVTTEDALTDWLADLGATHDATTVRSYDQYSVHWEARWPLLSDMTSRALADHVRERLGVVQATTVRKEASALRSFLAWCVERGHLVEAPTVMSIPKRSTGKVARAHRAHPDLRTEDVEAVLAKLPVMAEREHRVVEGHAPVRAWFRVLWETALRPSALLELEAPTHYRKGATDLILWLGADKARFARPLPLTDEARAALDEVCPDVGRLFPAKPGRDELRRAAVAAGLAPDVIASITPYSLRHARIVRLLEAGASLVGVQYLAGHKHVSTTARYVRPGHRHAVDALKMLAKTKPPPVSGDSPTTQPKDAKK